MVTVTIIIQSKLLSLFFKIGHRNSTYRFIPHINKQEIGLEAIVGFTGPATIDIQATIAVDIGHRYASLKPFHS